MLIKYFFLTELIGSFVSLQKNRTKREATITGKIAIWKVEPVDP